MAITIYTKPGCPFCTRAMQLLAQKGVDFDEIDASGDRRSEMVERAHGHNTFPQIFINEHHVGGCDDLFALDAAGKLDPLLAEAG